MQIDGEKFIEFLDAEIKTIDAFYAKYETQVSNEGYLIDMSKKKTLETIKSIATICLVE